MDTVLYLASLTTQHRRSLDFGLLAITRFALVSLTVLMSLFLLLRIT